jgi:hypothetical protein
MIFVPPQLLLTESLKLTVVALQLSVTIGTPVKLVAVLAGHSSVRSGGATIAGAVVSRMVINCVPVAVLPQVSVALQIREINFAPPQLLLTTSLKVTVTFPQPSCAVAIPVFRTFVFAGHSRVRFAGNVSVGGVESRTVIVWVAFVTLPQRSRAVHVRWTTFVPPQLVIVTSLNVTVAVLQPSTAVAIPVLLVLVFAGHSKVRFGGITNAGGVESRTVIV